MFSNWNFPLARYGVGSSENMISPHGHQSVRWQTEVKVIVWRIASMVPFLTTCMAWHEVRDNFGLRR